MARTADRSNKKSAKAISDNGDSPMKHHPYHGMVATLATMHRKEIAVAPPFKELVGLHVISAADIDTDALGTFSGDIPRIGSMGEVATRKARLGMTAANTRIGLASEGTFGPHPAIPFITAGMELLKLVDDDRGIEISESLVTPDIVFQKAILRPGEDLTSFLASCRFPSHGLIARPNAPGVSTPIIKDILTRDDLDNAIAMLARQSDDGRVVLSNDMRAHRNPTRMRSLDKLAIKLAQRVASLCPACGSPGFGKSGQIDGLPCMDCGSPTRSPMLDKFGCVACGCSETRTRADGKTRENPMYCDYCNP